MKAKRKILPVILVLLFSVLSQAQPSAQATMEVTVRIVKGVSATTTAADVTFTRGEFRGELGTVSLDFAGNSEVLVTNDSNIILVNDEGDEVEIPVSRSNFNTSEKPVLRFSTDGSSSSQPYNGAYQGTLNTTIEYI